MTRKSGTLFHLLRFDAQFYIKVNFVHFSLAFHLEILLIAKLKFKHNLFF
jgi:hypothetical protein